MSLNPMRNPTTARRTPWGPILLAVAAGVALAVQPLMAAVKVRMDFDKTFDFGKVRTYAWDVQGTGRVMAARTQADDPEAIRKQAEPVIVDAGNIELPKRGLTLAPAGATPDLKITYYLLLTIGSVAQYQGQFLPAVAQWGLPPFTPSTNSLQVVPEGSLVLDISAGGNVVWRGAAESKVHWEYTQEKRIALIREAVQKVLEKYPPKKK